MSEHNGKTVRCYHDTDDDSVDTREPTTLSFEEHGRFMRHLSGKDRFDTPLRERFESAALRFDCPTCGQQHYLCPICSDEDGTGPPGWFRGESSGEMIACHNCNAAEAARQERGY